MELLEGVVWRFVRDRRWFPKSARFEPERFLTPRVDEIPAGAFFSFGAGPHVCIGQSFAMMEMALVAATLLKSLDVSMTSGTVAPDLEAKMALRPKGHLMLRWQPRED